MHEKDYSRKWPIFTQCMAPESLATCVEASTTITITISIRSVAILSCCCFGGGGGCFWRDFALLC